MNARLRNSLSALAIAACLVTLGYAVGEPPRPGSLAADLGQDAVVALAATPEPSTEGRTTPSADGRRGGLAMPFFSFGRRASAGAP